MREPVVAVADYGVGNLFSLLCSLRALGVEATLCGSAEGLKAADKIILPGVGAFGDAAAKLRETGLGAAVCEQAARGKPLLGICLGMQLLFESSSEFGSHKGLGLIRGEIAPLAEDLKSAGFSLKVPHLGWNPLHLTSPQSPLLRHTNEGDAVYYVHSFYAKNCAGSVIATSEYGISVTGAVQNQNVYGTQFHPEKSGKVGLGMLKAFSEL